MNRYLVHLYLTHPVQHISLLGLQKSGFNKNCYMVLFIKLEIVEHYKCEEVALSAHLIMYTHICSEAWLLCGDQVERCVIAISFISVYETVHMAVTSNNFLGQMSPNTHAYILIGLQFSSLTNTAANCIVMILAPHCANSMQS